VPRDAELTLLVNPEGMSAATDVPFLERCFGTRWSEAAYRWYLKRPFGCESPDRLILTAGESPVAGCGLVYRLLRTPDGAVHPVSVAIAAGTLPEQRGRGYYARVMQAAADRSARRGCTALLGFATADNASTRGLQRLGAMLIASAYISSSSVSHPRSAATLWTCAARVTDRWPARAGARLGRVPAQAGFHYPDVKAWVSQMVERPHPVQPLRVGASCRALVENVGGTDRLQWLDGDDRERVAAVAALAARALHRRRHFFMYSTRPGDAEAAHRLGLQVRPGCMIVLPLGAGHGATVRDWATLPWHVQSGDRM
jgi:GNAT superfamily N-acetyltransferase